MGFRKREIMPVDMSILTDIVIIFALSTLVNFAFTKMKVPTVIGYLLTGIIAGPHLLKLVGSQHNIEIMAEIGVVLLLFSIGMEFSLKHLLRIRRIVFFGGFFQVVLTALSFFFVSYFYHLNWKTGLFIGFMAALSSSALVLKILQERSELTSNYGRTVLGILIFQDLMLVPLLLFSELIGSKPDNITAGILMMLLKTAFIIAFVYFGNKWIFPRLIRMIALTRNQELFLMSILLFCLAIAMFTSYLGMSLAFGAFLAGLMISESEYSHNAFGSLVPFKDTFSSFFFVSIGMLLDLQFVIDNIWIVFITTSAVILIKGTIAATTGFVLGHTFKGTILVGLALCQVGEFSFILAKIGLNKEIIPTYYYQLFLSVAIVTMSASPFLIKAARPIANALLKLPIPAFWVNGLFPLQEIEVPKLSNHAVIIGKDPVALKLSVLAKYVNMPYVSIVFDPHAVRELQRKGETAIYGDAINEPILHKAYVERAEIVVVSVGSLVPSLTIVERIRTMNKRAHIIVRAKDIEDIDQLFEAGADQIFPENFEISIDIFSRVLTQRLMPQKDINLLLGKIRNDFYGVFRERDQRNQENILDELPNIEITAFKVYENSELIGRSPAEINLRKNLGVTLVAIKRKDRLIEHPTGNIVFELKDLVYIMGTPERIVNAIETYSPSS